MLSLAGLGLLWATGVVLMLLWTEDDDQGSRPKKKGSKKAKASKADYSSRYSGLGGEIQRLEDTFEGAELVFAKAAYDRDDPRHAEAKAQLRELRRERRQ